MKRVKIRWRSDRNTAKKQKIFFACHPEDFHTYFADICRHVFRTHDCAICYDATFTHEHSEKEVAVEMDLSIVNCFIIPVTKKLLDTDAVDADIAFANQNHIHILPIAMEPISDEKFSAKFQSHTHYITAFQKSPTEKPFEEKLKTALERHLAGDETIKRIQKAFSARIFLSYRKIDREFANQLIHKIQENPDFEGVGIWFDEFLDPGENFNESIAAEMNACNLFSILVTPHLFEKTINSKGELVNNYVLQFELPNAHANREKNGTKILAVEAIAPDPATAQPLGADVYTCMSDADFDDRLHFALPLSDNKELSLEKQYLIGLAFANGIEKEKDFVRGLNMIRFAAFDGFMAAQEWCVYHWRGDRENEMSIWPKLLAENYFEHIFSNDFLINETLFSTLFSQYDDPYYKETLCHFLQITDQQLSEKAIDDMYRRLMQRGFSDYTLFFEACQNMTQHKELVERILLEDILTKSVDGTYSPYGPLCWYVSEYKTYEQLLLVLSTFTERSLYNKAVALVRDVCWIFGKFNTVDEITDRVDGSRLFENVFLSGVRRGLCELFYTGFTTMCGYNDIYPRCFNLEEAHSWKALGYGACGRMTTPFADDELQLYEHEMFSELNGEYIGIVATDYSNWQVEDLEEKLLEKSCQKLCGIFLPAPDSMSKCFYPLEIDDKHLRALYIPENATSRYSWRLPNVLRQVACGKNGIVYCHDVLYIPFDLRPVKSAERAGTCEDCTFLTNVVFASEITHIGHKTFYGCSALKSVTLPANLVQISNKVFWGCESLESILLPESVKLIGVEAFAYCKQLHTVYLPLDGAFTTICDRAFCDCQQLKTIYLPKSLTRIGNSAFKSCWELSEILLPENIIYLGPGAFNSCFSLEKVFILGHITSIGPYTFYHCMDLWLVSMPEGVAHIGPYAFCNCENLRTILLPKSVTHIGLSAFSGCEQLQTVPLQESGITHIGAYAFRWCKNLTDITLPDSIAFMAENAFEKSGVLQPNNFGPHIQQELPPDDTYALLLLGVDWNTYHSQKAASLTQDGYGEVGPHGDQAYFDAQKKLFEEKVVEAAYVLGDGTKIPIPDDTKIIKKLPWEWENSDETLYSNPIVSVGIPKNITKIDSEAFSGSAKLLEVNLSYGLEHIGEAAFGNCFALQKIELPPSVIKIEKRAFWQCESLTSFVWPPHRANNTLPEFVFGGCSGLTDITLHENVTKIEKFAFQDCGALTSIKLPEHLEVIDSYAFNNCYSLTEIRIPPNVFAIYDGAFAGCSGLKELYISRKFQSRLEDIFCKHPDIEGAKTSFSPDADPSGIAIHWL